MLKRKCSKCKMLKSKALTMQNAQTQIKCTCLCTLVHCRFDAVVVCPGEVHEDGILRNLWCQRSVHLSHGQTLAFGVVGVVDKHVSVERSEVRPVESAWTHFCSRPQRVRRKEAEGTLYVCEC